MLERRLYFHIDWALIVALIALCGVGLAMIYSTTGGPSGVYWTQIYAVILGLIVMAAALVVDYRTLAEKSHLLYLALVGALVFVMFFGAVRGGSRRWIDLGVFNLQPSEFAKVTLALVLAKLLAESRRQVLTNSELFIAVVLTAIPVFLIARQPDLGTAVTLLPILLVVTFVAGLPVKYLAALAIVGAISAPFAWQFALQANSP